MCYTNFTKARNQITNTITIVEEMTMKKWVCKVCGYIYEGPEAPAECPVCHAKSNMFEEVKGEMKRAAEHAYGV